MDTKRCIHCHTLERVDAQVCRRCGQPFYESQQETPAIDDSSRPSFSLASSQRVGHHSGLHPEDHPYYSSQLLAIHRHGDDDHARQEPESILLPSTDKGPAFQSRREAQSSRSPHITPLPTLAEELDAEEDREPISDPLISVPGRKPFWKGRSIPIILMISCVIFLVASSFIALLQMGMKRDIVATSPIIQANPDVLRTNDIFILSGDGLTERAVVTVTFDDGQPWLEEDGKPLEILTDNRGSFTLSLRIPADWSVGKHIITVTDQKQSRTISTSVQVEPLPTTEAIGFQLSNNQLDLGHAAAGVISKAVVTLSASPDRDYSWRSESNQSWLFLSPSEGTLRGSSELQVTVDRSGLGPGTYTGQVRLIGPDEMSATLTVIMTVVVPSGQFSLSTTELMYVTDLEVDPEVQSVFLQNVGATTLYWNAEVWTDDGTPWLLPMVTESSLFPGGSSEIAVAINAKGLVVGTYIGLLTFTGDISAQVAITLTVEAPGRLEVSSPVMTFTIDGQEPSPRTLTLRNLGNEPLTWQVATSTQNGGSWLRTNITEGSLNSGEQGYVQALVDLTGLTPGNYQGTLHFTTDTGNTREVTIKLVLMTLPVPEPEITPDASPSPIPSPSAIPTEQVETADELAVTED